jgi:hypothetical protein
MHGWTNRRIGTMERVAATKLSAWILAAALVFNGTCSALPVWVPPESPPVDTAEQRKAATAKAEVTRRGVGKKSRVRVKLSTKHELKGHITQIDEDSFQLQIDPDWLDEPSTKDQLITIPYAEVEKVRGPKSRVASIGIGVGMTLAAIVLLAAMVVLEAEKHRHCN